MGRSGGRVYEQRCARHGAYFGDLPHSCPECVPDPSVGQLDTWAHELFVDDDGSPETVWLTAHGRSALEAARLVNDCIGLDGDGFGVSMVYGVIVPDEGGVGEWRFRKVGPEQANETIAMWEVQLA